MENHLEKIRREHPHLNPAGTYAFLSEALTSEVAEQKIDYDAFADALTQYEERLQSQIQALKKDKMPQSAGELLKPHGRKWLTNLEEEQLDVDLFFDEIKDIIKRFPEKIRMAEMVDARIQADYPQFHAEYLEHRKWLEINAERLAHQEQRQLQDEPDQTRSQDGRAR